MPSIFASCADCRQPGQACVVARNVERPRFGGIQHRLFELVGQPRQFRGDDAEALLPVRGQIDAREAKVKQCIIDELARRRRQRIEIGTRADRTRGRTQARVLPDLGAEVSQQLDRLAIDCAQFRRVADIVQVPNRCEAAVQRILAVLPRQHQRIEAMVRRICNQSINARAIVRDTRLDRRQYMFGTNLGVGNEFVIAQQGIEGGHVASPLKRTTWSLSRSTTSACGDDRFGTARPPSSHRSSNRPCLP